MLSNHYTAQQMEDSIQALLTLAGRCGGTCTATLAIFLEGSIAGGEIQSIVEHDVQPLIAAIDALTTGEFVACSTLCGNSFQGGNGHVFCFVKTDEEVLWIQGNAYDSSLLHCHTGAQWFETMARRDGYIAAEEVDFYAAFPLQTTIAERTSYMLTALAIHADQPEITLSPLIKGSIRVFQTFRVEGANVVPV